MWEPKSHLNSKDYRGGLFPVWITLKEPVANADYIKWGSTGKAVKVAYRSQAIDTVKNLITSDTAFLYWETPPAPFIKIDSVEITQDSVKSWKMDTTLLYRDTIFAVVDGLESLPIVIEIKNILPHITSITVGDVEQPGDSLLTIAAHPGTIMDISIRLEKSFNQAFRPVLTMPQKMGSLRLKSDSDSLFVYTWTVPNDPIADSSIYLRVEDTGGYGERLYKIYLVVYTESGSVWVASENELVKYSPAGAEVVRISKVFNSISDIAINSNNGKLFVTDQSDNSFAVFDYYGKILHKSDSLFETPTGVAVDVVGNYVWVADETGLRRYKLVGDSLRYDDDIKYEMPDAVKGLSINQFEKNLVWFAVPEADTVGFVTDPILPGESPRFIHIQNCNRPSMVSYGNGIAWVADSSRVVGIDTAGKVLADIKGFGFVSSVSASGNHVWASDILTGKVYHFSGPFKGTAQDLALTVISGRAVSGFLSPVSVSAFVADGGAWVVDRDAGKVVRLDSLGSTKVYGTGLKRPSLGLTLQKVD